MEKNQRQTNLKLKLRISRILNSTLGSCNTLCMSSNVMSPAAVKPPPAAVKPLKHHQLIDLFSPRLKSFSFTNRTRGSQIDQSYSSSNTLVCPRRRVNSSDHLSLLLPAARARARADNQISPPPSPIMLLNTRARAALQKSRYPKRNRKRYLKKCDFDKYYQEFYSSYGEEDEEEEDEEEETTLFTSRSDASNRRNRSLKLKQKGKLIMGGTKTRNPMTMKSKEKGKQIMGGTKTRNPGFPVTKVSQDPYSDFRDSMVEMIVDRQLFGTGDLEELLQKFLSLNSICHHEVIMEVYTDIRETLFTSGA